MQDDIKNAEMTASKRSIAIFRISPRVRVRRTQQAIAGVLATAMLPLSLGSAIAQDYGPPPPPTDYEGQGQGSYQPLAPDQLDQLVAPIALYPDSLVAQVLAGATYPAQLASAEQFVQQGGNYPPEQLAEMANSQPWDPSVKSLVAFPQVLENLNQNMSWTTSLGNAYYNQPQDVMSAVQAMRQRAYAAGSLRPTSQLAVQYAPGDIIIEPVSPSVVYVPYYNPWVVYGAPIAPWGHYYYGPPRGIAFGTGLAIGFGVGIAIGAFTHFSWGYHNWAPDWHQRAVVFNRTTYISNSVTVINHGNYGHFDRNPQARAFNQAQASRFGGNRTVNNVTINRGGNTFNNGGNSFNRGGNTFNNGGNSFNRGNNTFNNGGNAYNRGGNTFNNNPGAGGFNRGAQPGAPAASSFNRGNQSFPNAPQGNRNPGAPGGVQPGMQRQQGNFGGSVNGNFRPQGNVNAGGQFQGRAQQGTAGGARPGGANQQAGGSQRSAPQQHAEPQRGGGGGGHENHGGGHDEHH